AKLLWQTAQGRVTWACDMAVWSSHDGEDTLFNQFVQQARATCSAQASPVSAGEHSGSSSSSSSSSSSIPASTPGSPESPPTESRNTEHEAPTSASTHSLAPSSISPPLHHSITPVPHSPWNLFFRVTMPDAVELGLLDVINRTKD